jgi:hypothetical protein
MPRELNKENKIGIILLSQFNRKKFLVLKSLQMMETGIHAIFQKQKIMNEF